MLQAANAAAGRMYYLQQQSFSFDVVFPQLSTDLATLSCSAVAEMNPFTTAKILWLGTGCTRSQLHFVRLLACAPNMTWTLCDAMASCMRTKRDLDTVRCYG